MQKIRYLGISLKNFYISLLLKCKISIMHKILSFLNELQQNNNRDWFKSNEKIYKESRIEFINLISKLIIEINKFDSNLGYVEPKECIFRIFRDVRFSKNKEPYKNNFGSFIASGGRKSSFAGYYIHIEPDASFIGGGIYMPPSDILKKIRTEIYENPDDFKSIINSKEFVNTFGEIYGEKLKTKPKGFDDFPDMDLIRYKHYAVVHPFSNNEILENDFINNIINVYKTQKPFNDYLNNCIFE
ncbi:MAG: TIGR02453 family protein [Marinilabiliales bacterium]|nr:MAG: TIGR02453 family protein [Marinilabiliales bacterium]